MEFKYQIEFPNIKSRKDECERVRLQFPDKIPVICEKDPSCTLEALVKTKYLIKRTITINQFKRTLLKKFKVESLEALFLFVTNKTQKVAVIGDVSFGEVYDKYKDDDGFLYLIYTNEKIWG